MTNIVAVAYMSQGKWVARCPRPGCHNGEVFGLCDDGTLGGLEGDRFTCRTRGFVHGQLRAYGGCGLRCSVEWPANIADIEALVLARPIVTTRNWHPGETVHDLLRENVLHGLVPNDELTLVGDRIRVGALTGWKPREIGA